MTRRFGQIALGFVTLAAALAVPALAAADDAKPNPSLLARINGVNDQQAMSKSLEIETLDAQVVIHGMVAETTLTIRFSNPTSQTLEGEFTLDMPLGSVVSGYALDVNGQMVDGVLVPPTQARRAYEQRVDRRVDPGIVEVSYGSRFSTRVFPIFPNNGRTIRLRFATPLDLKKGYVLPFGSSVSVRNLKLSVLGQGLDQSPIVSLPRGVDAKWGKDGLSFDGKNIQLGGELALRPKDPARVTVSAFRGEGQFFEIIGDHPKTANVKDAGVGKVVILWDRSRSRKDNDLAKDVALLEGFLARARPDQMELIQFDSSGVSRASFGDGASLLKAVRDVNYGGGTSFAVLDKLDLKGANTCLLFSDGIATIDRRDGFRPKCRLHAITSTREADRGYLASRASGSGGALIDLETSTQEEALKKLTSASPQVIAVRNDAGERIDVATLDGGDGRWRIIGEAPDRGGLTISLSVPGKGVEEVKIASFPTEATPFNGTGALWASNMIGNQAADRKKEELLRLARQYSVASPIAAFIVLETPADYAQAEIDPPMSYPKELRAQYQAMRDAAARQLAERKAGQLKTVLADWQSRVQWWTNPKLIPAKPAGPQPRRRAPGMPVPVTVQTESAQDTDAAGAVAAAPPPPPPPPPPLSTPPPPGRDGQWSIGVEAGNAASDAAEEGADAVIVTAGARRTDRIEDLPPSWVRPRRDRQERESKPYAANGWDVTRPYLKALDAAGDSFAKVFEEQEKEYGKLPAFYLDVSGWLDKRGRKAEAARMAASALDLPARNNDTIAIVAARLTRLGEVDRAIALLEQMLELEYDRPQPRRTLALALIQRAGTRQDKAAKTDLQRAFDLLAEVVNTPADGRYPGIETIALNDANAIIPRLRALGGQTSALSPKLIQNLDADMRVVVEWNTNRTDMDLWVDEADGERIIYNHPRSRKGGFLSHDMTQGFGPEEYFLRKAPAGTYTVRINTFSTDRLNPNGPTTVTARLYRNFGRPNQSEEVIDLEVLPGAEGERRIGRMVIGGK